MKKNYIEIDGVKVGKDSKPYIVAELSANHNGSIERAFEIMKQSKEAGADAIKLQTYTPDTITLNSHKKEFVLDEGPWKGMSLYDLYGKAYLPWEWHEELFKYAKDLDITIFSSPFDDTAIDLLEDLNAPAYKIASFECIDLPLIEKAASTKKPLIISTGMANESEIQSAINTARSSGCDDLIVLHCVSSYPSPPEIYNLKTLVDISERFDVLVGLSDHTIDNVTAVSSIALGSCLIEKHVTLDRSSGGPDDSFSLEPDELKNLCRDTEIAWRALGVPSYNLKGSEAANVKLRRSLYFVKSLKAGQTIKPGDIRSIRPGYGLPPKNINNIIGKKVKVNVDYATAVTEDKIEC